MARVLIPGALVGVAIAMVANIMIGGIFYNLLNETNAATFAGTLAASVVGAILGAIAISTAATKDTLVVLRGVAAGAFIGMIGGFLGSIGTAELDGISHNVEFISAIMGAIVGVAGLRGTGMKFTSPWDDRADDDMGTLDRALDGVFAGIMIGVACAVPVALFNRSIFISPNLIDRVRIEFVRVMSLDEILIGGIAGVIIGVISGLVLSRKRVDGLLGGMLIGAVAGIILALPIITVTAFTELGGIAGGMPYFGKVALAMIGGAAIGAMMPSASFVGRYRSALMGAGVGIVFALPFVIYATLLAIYATDDISIVRTDSPSYASSDGIDTFGAGSSPAPGLWDKILLLNTSTSISLMTSAVIGAMIGLITSEIIRRSRDAGTCNYAVCIVVIAAAISLQGGYFLFLLEVSLFRLGIGLPGFLYDSQLILRLLRELLIGAALGAIISLIGVSIASRLAARQTQP
ncbi:MAG: hypothetical protein OXH22_13225 [Chloroflexi bacterium]|nr:hypothetical protein [Chloroflexota bacterium]